MYFKREEPTSGSVNKLLLLSSIIIGCKKGKAPQLKTKKHFSIDGKKFLFSDWWETYFDLLSWTTDHALNFSFWISHVFRWYVRKFVTFHMHVLVEALNI